MQNEPLQQEPLEELLQSRCTSRCNTRRHSTAAVRSVAARAALYVPLQHEPLQQKPLEELLQQEPLEDLLQQEPLEEPLQHEAPQMSSRSWRKMAENESLLSRPLIRGHVDG